MAFQGVTAAPVASQISRDNEHTENDDEYSYVSEKAQLIEDLNIDIDSASTRSQQRQWARAILSSLALIALTITAVSYLVPNISQCMSPSRIDHGYIGAVNRHSKRADSPTDACLRSGQQSAIINGSLYLYGGSTTRSNSFTNNLITIDLKKTWNVARPEFSSLPQPSGPPEVANGFLWNSYDSIFQYGGRFSNNDTPASVSLWDYSAKGKSWAERAQPKVTGGNVSEPAGASIERVAGGAGVSVRAQGKGYYFGGYVDNHTEANWPADGSRQYLRSMVEYTFPGYGNTGVQGLSENVTAGSTGAWRNITQAGIQATAGFTPRSGNVLGHYPGWGIDGVILSIAGGRNDTETLMPMNIIEVYDVQTSEWFRQPTEGTTPPGRLNPCITSTTAADGSSFSIHMFGGQGVGSNAQLYNDMWILSVPAFSWIQVPTSDSAPPPRAGHTCDIWDGQMIVVGGTVTKDVACDSPGVYVFNTSALEWTRQFTPLSTDDNPFSQQTNQKGATKDSGLHGSYAYTVPDKVVEKIGGNSLGNATVTVPLLGVATWAHTTSVSYNTASMSATPAPPAPAAKSGGTNVGAAVAGAVAGFFFLVAVYLALCALVYRQQIAAYRKHIVTQGRPPRGTRTWNGSGAEKAGLAGAGTINKSGSWRKASWFSNRGGSQKSMDSDNSRTGLGSKGEMEGSRYGAASPDSATGRVEPPAKNPLRGATKAVGKGGAVHHSSEDLAAGSEPSYWGVILHPRQNLRVMNR